MLPLLGRRDLPDRTLLVVVLEEVVAVEAAWSLRRRKGTTEENRRGSQDVSERGHGRSLANGVFELW